MAANKQPVNLDQFYTKRPIAKKYYDVLLSVIDINYFDHIIEPSAGNGSFYDLFNTNNRIGIDIDPKHDDIIKMDYLKYDDINKDLKYIVVGNPPFGKNSSVAVGFFNKSAEFADVIAFIIPRTFKRVSIQNQLNLNFTLLYSDDLPMTPCCFEPNMSAKCCFQIWKKQHIPRTLIKYNKTHPDFIFIKLGPKDKHNQPTPPLNADFVIKAYGSNCGHVVTDGLCSLRPKSWHWIKSNIDISVLIQRINELDFSISRDTVRQDSIGQQEFINLYMNKYG